MPCLIAALLCRIEQRVKIGLVETGRVEFDLRASKLIEEQIAIAHFRLRSTQNQMTTQTELGTKQCGSATVVGLHTTAGNDGIAAVLQCLSQREFQLAHFVATQHAAGEIVALHPEADSLPKPLTETIQRLQGGGQLRQWEPWGKRRQGHDQIALMVPLGSTALIMPRWNLSSILSPTCSTT